MDILFPEKIDNSMRKELVKCETAAHYRYEAGIESADTSRVDLIAGKAFAKGMERMRKAFYIEGKKERIAVGEGVVACTKEYGEYVPDKLTAKTVHRMAGAITFYAQEFPLETEKLKPVIFDDGTNGIECYFEEMIPLVHPDTGKPLYYCGNFDLLALDENGECWIVDEKTTSQMGDKWGNQWFLDAGLTGYCWGARKLLDLHGMSTTPIRGAYINGIAIRKYDYEPRRLAVYREQWEIDRWYDQMIADVQRWKRAYMTKQHNQVLDHACALYNNPCQFAPLCKSRNPDRLVDGSYVVRRWNPSERN